MGGYFRCITGQGPNVLVSVDMVIARICRDADTIGDSNRRILNPNDVLLWADYAREIAEHHTGQPIIGVTISGVTISNL